MGVNGWRVADSDMHVMEPPDLWQRYIDPACRHAAPIGLTELRRDMRVRVKNHTAPYRPGAGRTRVDATSGVEAEQDDAVRPPREARGWDSVSQLEAMDAEGLDVAVLFPSRGLFVLGLDTRGADGHRRSRARVRAAIARAYNDWLHDFCAEDPARLFGAGLLAPHDIDAAVAEDAALCRGVRLQDRVPAPGLRQPSPVARPVLRPAVARVRATRRADQLPRRRSELSAARLTRSRYSTTS